MYKPRVLIAPLDWGLGHATRCIPIIKELKLLKAEVFIAAKGATKIILEKEFPDLNFLELFGYNVKYTRHKNFLPMKIFMQIPKIIITSYRENRWLKKIIIEHKIDAVISDNRPGLYNKNIFCVYITHQLLVNAGNKFIEKIIQVIHYWFIKKYDECWVPDFKKDGLAGKLSHPEKQSLNIKYAGALSRFEKKEQLKKYDLLIILSGPEPQRSILENIFFKELKNYSGKFLLVRGLPENNSEPVSPNQQEKIINHISAIELNKVIDQSEIVICRSGYSTIMDLVKLKKKAIIIPTPGQTEQEYLAKFLMEKNMFYAVDQNKIDLKKIFKEASMFPFQILNYDMEEYKKVIAEFIKSLSKRIKL